ncbi:vomeronasal type-2 receptor 26-like [Eleutherodactylus coqui]|uniref:vomeronasal type-2 receptor 26-like n=1 Tax=Eleutherodactylus coqui TaxID=57060 RepID=UPI003461C2C7
MAPKISKNETRFGTPLSGFEIMNIISSANAASESNENAPHVGLMGLPDQGSKFFGRWQGPYEIVEKVDDVNYRVQQQGKRKPYQVYHVNLIKPWKDRDAENCIKCQGDEWPNEKRDQCLPKVLEFISYQNDTMASVFSGISVFGCLVTSFIFRIFVFYRDTPIVKANNRNLSYLLLVSIILSFRSIFLFLGRPSDVTCRLRETSFGIFFSVAISSLLAKTIMVCVAFKSTKPGSPWRKWLSVKLPYTIVLLCSSIQIVICVTWLSVSPQFQDLDSQSYPGKIIIQCNEGSDICFYSMLGYMGLLAAVSFVLAFMVRTLPDSFNEAKYITFSMLLFCSVWISMIPAYLSTKGKYMVVVEIFAVMSSSAGLLVCVFFPKCFIILFRSEMNRKTDLLGKGKE